MKEYLLVTGVAGFIASHVARRLQQQGYNIIGIDDLSHGTQENIPSEIEFIKGDLSQKSVVEKLPQGCLQVLHLAGQSSGEISFDDPVSDLHKNVISTLNLLDWSMRHDVQKFLYASSMSVYGPVADQAIAEQTYCKPLSCYGVGKYTSEGYLRVYSHKIPSISFRMYNVYGPGQNLKNMRQGMVSIFVKQALDNHKVQVKGDLNRYRDFIFIEDVVEFWNRAVNQSFSGAHVLNLGTGVRTTVKNLLESIAAHMPGLEWYVEGSTPGDQFGIYADTTQLRKTLGEHSFVNLNNGMKTFLEWAKANV